MSRTIFKNSLKTPLSFVVDDGHGSNSKLRGLFLLTSKNNQNSRLL